MRRLTTLAVILAAVAVRGQTILFEVPTPTSLGYANVADGTIYADDVKLPGSVLVDTLRIPYLASFVGSVTSDVTAYLYAGDDFGGFPGTLLWSSNRSAQVLSTVSTLVFNNVDTLVPPLCYWAVRFSNIHTNDGDILGLRFGEASNAVPENSTGPRFVYTKAGSTFDTVFYGGIDSTFAASFEGPETPTNPPLDIAQSISISFLSTAGTNYLAQYASNLLSGLWYDLESTKFGTGGTLYFHDDSPDAPSRSYRLLSQ